MDWRFHVCEPTGISGTGSDFRISYPTSFLIAFAFPTSVSSGAIHVSASQRDHPSGRGSAVGDFETGGFVIALTPMENVGSKL